ncbi:MAG: hypothetical protein JO170_00275 [Verrucomicrobia bacterium]|nr:hypothetical protein [Verrucomicrobiota bacterium]
MKTSKDFPKILSLLEKVNEDLARGGDPQHCKAFLDAYLIDIFAEQGEPAEAETKTVYEITTVESLLNRLTHKELSFLASGEGEICDDLLARYPMLEVVKEILSVYDQLRKLESRQPFLHESTRRTH